MLDLVIFLSSPTSNVYCLLFLYLVSSFIPCRCEALRKSVPRQDVITRPQSIYKLQGGIGSLDVAAGRHASAVGGGIGGMAITEDRDDYLLPRSENVDEYLLPRANTSEQQGGSLAFAVVNVFVFVCSFVFVDTTKGRSLQIQARHVVHSSRRAKKKKKHNVTSFHCDCVRRIAVLIVVCIRTKRMCCIASL